MGCVIESMVWISDPTGSGTDPICSSCELKVGRNEKSLAPGAVWRLKEFVLFAEVLNRSKELKSEYELWF